MVYTALLTRTYHDQWLESLDKTLEVKPLSPSMVFVIDKGWLMYRDHSVESGWVTLEGEPNDPIEGLVCGQFTPGYGTMVQGEGKAYYFKDLMIVPHYVVIGTSHCASFYPVFKPHS